MDLASTRAIGTLLGAGIKSGFVFTVTPLPPYNPLNLLDLTSRQMLLFLEMLYREPENRNFYSNEVGVVYENRGGQNSPPSSTSAINRIVVNGTPID